MTTLQQAKKQVDDLTGNQDPARRVVVNWEPSPDPPAPGVRVISWGRPTITGPPDFIKKMNSELERAWGSNNENLP